MKRIVNAFLAFVGASLILTAAAEARVSIHVDLSSQTMTVNSSSGAYVWRVSTARSGYVTPRGTYRPTSLQRMHYSKKYHNSPMPHSIFFRGGYAIHGTYATRALGRPASHGCIRLAPGNAAALFQMVRAEGATISITGSPPHTYYASRHTSKKHYASRHKGKKHYASRHYKRSKSYASRGHHRHRAYYAGRYRSAPMAYAPYRNPSSPRYWQYGPARY